MIFFVHNIVRKEKVSEKIGENENDSQEKVFYVHGLEGSFKGLKGTYLSKKFEVIGVDMDVSIINVGSKINFVKYFASTFFSRDIFSSFSRNKVIQSMVKECERVQFEELKKYEGEKFTCFLGSSWGAVVLMKMLGRENAEKVIPVDSKIMLLSPAQGAMYSTKDYRIPEGLKKYKNVKVIHSEDDKKCPFESTEKMCKELNWQLIKVPGNDHGLYEIVKDENYRENSLYEYIAKW